MSAHPDLSLDDGTTYFGYRLAGAGPAGGSLPVRWSTGHAVGRSGGVVGGAEDVARAGETFERPPSGAEPEPDAHARGWVRTGDEPPVAALFVLAGPTLGVSREQSGAPMWLDLRQLVNLDALGDPSPGPYGEPLQEVEVRMEDRSTLRAGWPEAFCDQVVRTLERLSGRRPDGPDVRLDQLPDAQPPATAAAAPAPAPAPPAPAAAPPGPAVPAGAAPAPAPAAASPAVPSPAVPSPAPADAPMSAPSSTAPSSTAPSSTAPSSTGPAGTATDARAGTLELEDVVYLGGYPGHGKRRKRCTATLGRAGLELRGPGDLHFRIAWDVVRTIEVQNADEARFRMNVKIHRDASALVIECDQSVTILLEARDCPTIALRAAIGQLLTDTPVVVV